MRIGIIGAGRSDAWWAACSRAGEDVTLVDQWPEHVETIRTPVNEAAGGGACRTPSAEGHPSQRC